MTTDPARILVVDDDPSLRSLVGVFLGAHGYQIFEADGGAAMRAILERESIDLVILDVMMPGEDGLSLARGLAAHQDVAIIFVSALGSETDRIIGLEVGADDYVAKPASPRELLARVRAVLRRRRGSDPGPGKEATFLFDGWRLDLARRILHDPKKIVISLSDGDFSLLRVFVERPRRVLNRDQLLELSRGPESDSFDRAIDTQVSRLRRKLSGRSSSEIIRTVRSEGYMFLPSVTRGG